jgi:photosystem II stability/assembly factor-like uncharacterized protein
LHKPVRGLCCFLISAVLVALPVSAQSVPPELYNGLKWRLIGPFRGGRAVAASGIPGNSTTFYFGAVDGGIWQTTDGGVVWKPIFDDQHVASIGALAVAPSDPKVIYAGTGESDIRSDLASGNGVYKSSDGGRSWTNVGLRDSRQISRLVVDPRDANTVYVAALGHAHAPNDERGVFKSIDGGSTWTRSLDLGPETGAADLAMAADKPNILFVTMWRTHRPPWSTYGPITEPGGGLYRSIDSGKTWVHLTSNGLPEGDWARSGVAVSADGKRVYALIDAAKNPGLYRSDDGGDTWVLANPDKRITNRSWYFASVTVDPQNPDVLYIPNTAFYRSEDGGKTLSIVRGAPGGDDYHQVWIDPQNSSRLVLASDQGTTVSVNYGETWSSWYNQPTAQLYHVITDDKFPYAVYGTQQDSGGMAVYSRTDHGRITPRDWFSPGDSESGYIAPDPKNPDIIYLSGSYGSVSRFDLRTSFSQDVTPWPVPSWGSEIVERKYRDPWTPVLLFSPIDKQTLFLGTQFVMKTTDGGLHWQTISPDLTGATRKLGDKKPEEAPTLENSKRLGYGVVYSIAPSSLNKDLIWAGSDTGLIHVTRDGGKSWKDVTPGGLGDWSKISLIEASHFDPAEAYAAVDRHRLDDQAPYLYRTRDYGATWQRITSGLQAPAFLRAIREDPRRRGLLFAGTELGVCVSFDDGEHWQSLQLNLPVSAVHDLVIHGDDLVIATHGRSFWILDDITALRQTGEAMKTEGAWLFRPETAVRIDNDGFAGTPLPPDEPTAENPTSGAVLDYYLPRASDQVKVEILDGKNEVVRAFSSSDHPPAKRPQLAVADRWLSTPQVPETAAGMHRLVWDFAWTTSGGQEVDDFEAGAPGGPRAVPGEYQVRLTVDGKSSVQPLKIVMDPRSSATPAELEQQFQLGQKMFETNTSARRGLAEVMALQKQLSAATMPAKDSDLQSAVKELQDEIGKILKGSGEISGDGIGMELAAKGLSGALRVVESSDRAVPAQAMEVFTESDRAMRLRLEEWERLKTEKLPRLNDQLKKANMAPLAIGEIELDDDDQLSQ